MIFTVEETALAAAFDHSSRSAAIIDMMDNLSMIQDLDLRDQVSKLCKKMKKISDDDFIRVDFTVYEEAEDE